MRISRFQTHLGRALLVQRIRCLARRGKGNTISIEKRNRRGPKRILWESNFLVSRFLEKRVQVR